MPKFPALRLLLPLAALALLAACGGAAEPAAPAAAEPAAPASTVTVAPVAEPPAAAATELPAAAATELPAAAATELPAADGPFAGIPQGRTPEGYHMLGAADAPVTLVMYSDFL